MPNETRLAKMPLAMRGITGRVVCARLNSKVCVRHMNCYGCPVMQLMLDRLEEYEQRDTEITEGAP